jgi:hypothetical protein
MYAYSEKIARNSLVVRAYRPSSGEMAVVSESGRFVSGGTGA